MSGSWLKGHRGYRRDLLENSLDAYVLALETINRLSVQHRVEAFTFLLCNAWELLLKARILQVEKERKAIFRPTKRGEPAKTISLRECLERVYPEKHNPVRRNIERVAVIRDDATHVCIKDVPKNVLAVFQAAVVNYHGSLTSWFGISLTQAVPVGMMTIVFDMTPDRFNVDPAVLRKKMDASTVAYLMKQQAEIEQEHAQLGRPLEYSVVFKHELRIERHPGFEAISFTGSNDGLPVSQVHVPKRPDISHPYRCKELVDVVRSLLPEKTKFGQHEVTSIVAAHNIQNRPEFYFHQNVVGSPKQYSQAFAEWIVERCRQDDQFLERACAVYKAKLQQKTKRRGAA